jgi:hypothetical protein
MSCFVLVIYKHGSSTHNNLITEQIEGWKFSLTWTCWYFSFEKILWNIMSDYFLASEWEV